MTKQIQMARDRDDADLPEGTACYVYGLVPGDSGGVSGDVTGLDDAPVELVVHGDVAAVVGIVAVDRPPGRRKDLLAHSAVLDAFAGVGPVVPVRFGSLLPHRGAVRDELLAPDHDRFVDLLSELAGRAQFNLRARYNEAAILAEVVAERPEIARLRERTRDLPEDVAYAERIRLGELVSKALEDKRSADTQILLDALLRHAAAYSVREGADLDHMADVAFLVNDEQRDAFEEAAESVAEAMHERARLRLLGPLAPYDFVAEE